MTANQIEYAKHLETQRHNRVSESQGAEDVTSRRITANATASQASTAALRQTEDARHNRETEMTNWFHENQLAQYQRTMGAAALQQAAASTQQASAALLQADAAQQQASSRQYEAETQRIGTTNARLSSIAQFIEGSRHNRAMESTARTQAAAAAEQAAAATTRAETDAGESTSRRFRNYAAGAQSISGVVTDAAQSIINNFNNFGASAYNRKVDKSYENPFF